MSILYIILAILLFHYVLELMVETLNVRHASPDLPKEFADVYDQDKYKQSQLYLKDNTRLSLWNSTLSTLVLVSAIFLGFFPVLDSWVRSVVDGEIQRGLLFIASIAGINYLLQLPLSIYHTFVIEERYGFNKSTPWIFFTDQIKAIIIGSLIGGIVLSAILWFFESTGSQAWLFCWIAMTALQFLFMFLVPVLIMPLFNKFEALPDGDLKEAIETYAKSQNFSLSGVYTMDASKRSTKANAFFTGFGKSRRIVLFDTLVNHYSTEELVAVLAHEMGHFKKKHIVRMLSIGILNTGILFYFLHLCMKWPALFEAFSMEHLSVYASLVFFTFLYSPLSTLTSLMSNILSRKHEFEADAYAIHTYEHGEKLISALKKLSVDSLSNLTPHPLKVFLEHSHPPVLQRIDTIREEQKA
ncbi:MAG: peptidase M48 [Waddliaceae bacterium]|nr:peptidase M48 [Waddliaceae bacterium]